MCTQGLILGPVLLKICINDPADGTRSTLGKVTDDTEGGVARTPGGCAAIQRDLDRLKNYDDRNLIKFNSWKCSSAPGEEKPQTSVAAFPLVCTSSSSEKRSGSPGGHQGEHEPAKGFGDTEGLLGCMRENVASRLREVIFPICSTLRKPCLECSVQRWASQYREDTDLQE